MQKLYTLHDGRVVQTTDEDAQVVVYVGPDEEEKRHLVDDLKIDQHTLASALDPDELSRLEFEPEHMALIVKLPRNYSSDEEFVFRVVSMGLFLFENRLIVVVHERDPVFEGKPFVGVQSVADVVLRLIYRSIFHFLQHLKTVNMVSEELEQKISASMENRYLLNLFTLEKSLVYYLNAIHTNGVLITKLKTNHVRVGLAGEQLEFLDDIMVENEQCYKLAEIYSNVLSSMMDARASIVNNNLNMLMKTLNIITIGIMVPTFVVSVFSMNVPIPWDWRADPNSFWYIVALGAVSATGVMMFWRYKKFW